MMPSAIPDKVENSEKAQSVAFTKTGYLTGADNIFLRAEHDAVTINVSGLYFFERSLPYADLRETIRQYVDQSDYCSKKLRWPSDSAVPSSSFLTCPQWVPAVVNLDDHILRVQLPAPGTKEQLQQLVANHHNDPFDFNLPLWNVVIYEGYDNGTKSVVMMRAHHMIGDGQAFVRRLIEFVASKDPKTGEKQSVDEMQYHAGRVETEAHSTDSVQNAVLRKTSSKQTSALSNFVASFVYTLTMLIGFFNYLWILIDLYFISSHTMFIRPTQSKKRQVGWSTLVQLDQVKQVKNALHCTVNDVLTACVGAAIERHVRNKGLKVDPAMWFIIPTSLRPPTDTSISNMTSAYLLRVPCSGADSVKRVKDVHKRMKRQKMSPEPSVTFSAISLGFAFPNLIPEWMMQWGKRKFEVVLTNVPGPAKEILWAGEPMDSIVAFIPQAHANGIGATVYTYKGHVTVSICLAVDDPNATPSQPHPADALYVSGSAQAIADEFDTVFKELLEESRSIVESRKDR
ncbi:wax ester synthase-like acyl-CoA acyltransferase domain-containing protein [Cladochytrium replicatum]|nr:wax ester synthase-like acyl-CoA acyltransferase domain-containing protein [Cladochytrium replicatum]